MRRLTEFGYSPLAIAHAFSALTGPDTVEETLAQLAQNSRSERSRPAALDFETAEQEPGLPIGHVLTITSIERDDRRIRIMYTIRPPLASPSDRPRVDARDDRGREYGQLGESHGLAEIEGRSGTVCAVTLPIPHPHAVLLSVRLSWSKEPTSPWERPAYGLRIRL